MRELDIVLVGATGYTGRSCATYIATKLPPSLRWGVAGRDKAKLEKLVESFPTVNDASKPVILPVDVKSKDEMGTLAKKAGVVISVVGPYAVAGTETFEACARNGTHYLDCNGEAPWLKDMIQRFETEAKKSGSIMIPCCGIGVVPADMSTYLLSTQLRNSGTKLATSLVCCHDFVGSPSGGTVLSVLNTLSQYGIEKTMAACEPFAMSPTKPAYLSPLGSNHDCQRSHEDFAKVKNGTESVLGKMNGFGVQTNEHLGTMITSPQDDMDRAIVTRTCGLLFSGKSENAYSPNYHYGGSRVRYDSALKGWSSRISYISKILLAVSPLSSIIRKYWYDAGEGPGEEERKSGRLEFRAIGVGETADRQSGSRDEGSSGNGKDVAMCRMRFEGDLYLFTALCLSEAAMILLEGDTGARQQGGGILTCAFLGEKFAERLQHAGVQFQLSSLRQETGPV